MTFAVLFFAGWIICGFFAWGLTMGDFTRKYPYMKHIRIAMVEAALGYGGLIAALVMGRPYCWRVRPIAKEERWQLFNREHGPYLNREYFERTHG